MYKPEDGSEPKTYQVNKFTGKGVALGMFNTEKSIIDFAHCCFKYALKRKFNLYMSTKNTILKVYDGMFKDIFEKIYKNEYEEAFQAAGIR